MRKLGRRLTFANVASALALFFALSTGAAYANHEMIFSNDIVNGEVKRPDVGADAVASQEVVNGSLVGADIDESTLTGVNAKTLNGLGAGSIVRVGGSTTSAVVGMPDCNPGIDYMARSITAPRDGWALVNASFTASHPAVANNEPIAARIEKTAPQLIIGAWQEGTLKHDFGRDNISITEVFPISQGSNTFVLKVCDGSDFVGDGSGETIRGQVSIIFTPFRLSLT